MFTAYKSNEVKGWTLSNISKGKEPDYALPDFQKKKVYS